MYFDDLPKNVSPVFFSMDQSDWDKCYPVSYHLKADIMIKINDLPVYRLLFLNDLISAWVESSGFYLESEFSNLLNAISPSIIIGHDSENLMKGGEESEEK